MKRGGQGWYRDETADSDGNDPASKGIRPYVIAAADVRADVVVARYADSASKYFPSCRHVNT